MVTLQNNYNSYNFAGKKTMVLSTAGWLGGRNAFLGRAYVVVGMACFLFALLLTLLCIVFPMSVTAHILSSLLGGGEGAAEQAAAAIKSILKYPIKSCRGISVPQVPVTSTAIGRVQVGSAVGGGERQREGLHLEGGAQDGAGRGGDAAGGVHRGLAALAGLLLGYKSTWNGCIEGPSCCRTRHA